MSLEQALSVGSERATQVGEAAGAARAVVVADSESSARSLVSRVSFVFLEARAR